ncbi:DUF2963 domain-containing protein [Poinsettia branch-inducing phytoplasma]|uniref:DUF2963 domain-containing protein n=1 Tax=Poinsettia branch-inducing phytoplasma TaxID=138647 RepID=UPI000372C502|nr:DUF2963 domain-containing protein [Poinsettia branch-inducing phytoplasma]
MVSFANWKTTHEIAKIKEDVQKLSQRDKNENQQIKKANQELLFRDKLNFIVKEIHPSFKLSSASENDPVTFKPSKTDKFLSFAEIIGMQKEKEILEEFILYAQKTKNRKSNGKCEAPMGILMYGTAGTGKTILARAVAKETNLPFFEISSSMFFQKYKGVEKNLVINLFKSARKEAQKNNGAIIFLDECDTIFTDLGSLEANSDTANVVNQFKTELTSTENDVNNPIFIIAATNHFQKLDEAIKSRFDYKTEVKVGDFKDRKAFLEFMIKKRGNEYSEKAKDYLVEDINNKLDELSFLRGEEIKSNRTLENFLKAIARVNERAINISNTNRGNSFNIFIEDIQKAYTKVYNTDDFPEPILKRVFYKSDDKTINYIEENKYNSDEKLIKKTFYNSDGKNIDYIFRNEYNSDKKIIKTTYFQSDDKTINCIEEYEYDPDEKLIKTTQYQPDGKTINRIYDYDSNEKIIKTTFYNSDGQTINCIEEYEYNSDEKIIKTTYFQSDYKTINCIEEYEYDPDEKLIKTTQYQPDGKTIYYVEEYDSDEKPIKTTQYQSDGKTINYTFINEYDPDKKLTKKTQYQSDGQTINFIYKYDPDEKLIKTTQYQSDGKTINCFEDYDSNEKIIKTTFYNSDGQTINCIEEYDSNEKPIKTTFYNSDGQIINCF